MDFSRGLDVARVVYGGIFVNYRMINFSKVASYMVGMGNRVMFWGIAKIVET